MRVLYCNKYNYPFSGTEVYLFELMDLMRAHNHEVALFSMADPRGELTEYDRHFVPVIDFKERCSWAHKARKAAHAVYSLDARCKIRAMIRDFRPDIAHVRNIYHHLSPSILWELTAHNIPVVFHINDFKPLCPNYNLVADGKVCEACKGGAFWNVLKSQCYPGLGAQLTLSAEAYVHRWLGTYRKCVDLFLAPSRFVRDKFVEHGWDPSKFYVLPHFQRISPVPDSNLNDSSPVLYVGRLSPEKGIDDLLRAMKAIPYIPLVIAGDGPQRGTLQLLAANLGLRNVMFVGQVGSAERDRLIARSRFTVLPSHAYETLGKTILESYAQARAVIATDLGSRRELVRAGETGVLYKCGDVQQLADCIKDLSSNSACAVRMGRAGWDLVRRFHSPEQHYSELLTVYEDVAAQKKSATLPLQAKRKGHTAPAFGQTPPPLQRPQLRIAFIGGRGVISKYSGIETYYEQVAEQLAEMGHEVTVYCRNYFTPAVSEYNGMRLVRLPTIRSKHLDTAVHTFVSSAHSLMQSYDIVHYHALGPALFSFVPHLLRTKTAVTVQGLDWQRKKWGRLAASVLRVAELASAYLPDRTIVVSRELKLRYDRLHGIHSVYIPNGGILRERVAPRKILQWGLKPSEYVLFLGRFSPEKGCHLLVQAFEQIQKDVKLVMAGGSSYSDGYARELRNHASDRILFLNWVSGEILDELLTNAMIFVLPSDLEGLSLALLDAMGAGLCVLTSDIPENREVVDGAGFTFRAGDAGDLEDRLRFLIANLGIRQAAGRAARKRIEEHYSWPQIAKQMEQTYFEMLGLNRLNIAASKPRLTAQTPSEAREEALRAG